MSETNDATASGEEQQIVADGGNRRIDVTDDGIKVTLHGRISKTVDGWEESREDLGLNKHGDPVEGVELHSEMPEFHDPGDEYPYGYSRVTLLFENIEALKRARSHLRDKATERFEWGADGEAVQDFVGRLPSEYEIEQNQGAEGDD